MSTYDALLQKEQLRQLTPDLPHIDWDEKKTYSSFCGVSYADLADIRRVLTYHVNGYFAFILHDRDIKEITNTGEVIFKQPHTHIVFYDQGRHSVKSVVKWFEGLLDGEGKPVNTLMEPCGSIRGALRYLVHLDDPEKTAYNLNEVHCSSYTCANRLYDACSLQGSSIDRQISVAIQYVSREIDFITACKRCPELFMKNQSNAMLFCKRIAFDIGIKDWQDEMFKEENVR